MISKVKDTIEKYNMIDGGDKIFAAVSGGADSVALLLVLKSIADELGFSLEAIHVEHGIRGKESEDDAKFVEDLCKRLGVRCHIYHIDAPNFAGEWGYSLEEAARILRYECFDKHTTDGKVAIAHNMDDNAETMLYNMVRGTGIEGIRGIKKVRDNFIRPLIECTRYEIEKFLEAEGRDFRTDSTNEQTDYTRNKIRHNVMPVLLEINPGAIKHFANLSNMQDMAVEYIDSQADKAYGKYVTEASASRKDGTENSASKEYMTEATVSKEILKEELIIVKSVIKKVLTNVAKTAKDIASVHIDAVYDLMCGGVGRSVDLPYGMKAVSDYESVTIMKAISDYESVTVMKSDGEAQKSKKEAGDGLSKETAKLNIKNIAKIEPDILDIGDSEEVEFNGTKFRLSIIAFDSDMEITSKTYTKMLDYDKITDRLCIRSRKEGDYIVINDKGSKKSLKRYMIDEKIPARERGIWPIVCDGAHVMYIAGHRISEYYKIDDSTKRVLVIEVITNNP